MFALSLLLALQGVFIGGHMVKSDVHHGVGSSVAADQILATNVKIGSAGEDATGGAANNQEFLRSIAFHPLSVDFGSWSIGTARSYLVTLINKNANKSVHLSSISGNTQEFYSSFFEDKVVPPQGNTTFNVVFLPRRYGPVETDLLIHTSFGQAKLPVKGVGKECPYRIKSLVGIRAPFNATITPEIHMYNPHSKPIQILEIYSSGGKFQLELPSGGQEGPQTLWEIPPYTTKPVIRMKFHGSHPGNHTAFIRIKISEIIDGSSEHEESTLVIPVEIEICEATGLYSRNPVLDFGTLTSTDAEKVLDIELLNSGSHTFEGMEYNLENVAGLIELHETDLTLHLNPNQALFDTHVNGFLSIRMWRHDKTLDSENHKKYVELSIGLRAEVYKGSLEFEKNRTVFITGARNYSTAEREFPVHNSFKMPIAIHNVTVDNYDTSVFKISDFTARVVAADGTVNLFKIAAINHSANFQTDLKIHTNISTYILPVVICAGRLNRFTSIDPVKLAPLPDRNALNFGSVQYGDLSHIGYILLHNPNPIAIQLQKWNFTNPRGVYYQSVFLGCSPSPGSARYSEKNLNLPIQERFELCWTVLPDHVAAFQLAVQSYSVKSFSAVFNLWTDYEDIETTINFAVVMGRLEVDQSRLHFAECFPGKRCSADISIHSTFVKNMQVNSITVSVPGLVFEYHTQEGLPEITANAITDIGRIHFDPKSVCGKRCYVLPDGVEGDAPNLDFHAMELRRRTDLFRRFKYNLQMITFTLNTSEVRLFEFNATVDIIWPKLFKGHQILPTIEIGQQYDAEIPLANPSNGDIRVEISIADPAKAKATSLSLPLEVVDNCAYCYLTDEDVFVLGAANDKPLVLNIEANSAAVVPLKFIGRLAGKFSTIIHVYNNLTLYEAVWITGKAVQPQFRFGNRKPGSTTPLLFEISEKHLAGCEQTEAERNGPLIVSAKRTFTARNTGEVPILVEMFLISDSTCEGYGFKVADCASFELKANSSKKIDISFTPDFTMTRISQQLTIKTNLSNVVNYTLLATVPAAFLNQCSKAIQRPFWEGYMKKMSVGVLMLAFVFVLIAAFIDSDKILKDHVQNMSRERGPMQPPLDLRNIGMRTSISDEPLSSGTVISSSEKNANKLTVPIVKKRNVKRNNSFTPPSPPLAESSKQKSWAEELARKIRTASYSPASIVAVPSSSSSAPVKPAVATKPIQYNSATVTTPPKPQKEERSTPPTKKTSPKDLTGNGKTLSERTPPTADKRSEAKQDSPTQGEYRKLKVLFKKAKSTAADTSPKEVDNAMANAVDKSQEKSCRAMKTSPKEKTESEVKKRAEYAPTNDAPSHAPKRDSPTNNTNSILSSTPRGKSERKFGKTPGRERKKDQMTQSASSKRRIPKFKGTAFQFTAPLATNTSNSVSTPPGSANTPSPSSTNHNVWDMTQATSFSNIVAQKPLKSGNDLPFVNYGVENVYDEMNQDSNNNNSNDWNEADLKNHETFGPGADNKGSCTDLGPIGPKKSPTSTPLWNSFIDNIQRPTAHFSQQSSNTSFFSSNFPIGANLEYSNSQFLGGASNLLEHIFSENQHYDHIPANDMLLSWLQRESIRQQTNWTGNRTWTPMGYQDDPVPNQTNGDQINSNAIWQPTTSSAAAGGIVRPPPGLPVRSDRCSPIHQQQVQLQASPQQQPQQPQQLQQQQSAADLHLPNAPIDQLQSYEPYTTFTSIWSDPWNKAEKK